MIDAGTAAPDLTVTENEMRTLTMQELDELGLIFDARLYAPAVEVWQVDGFRPDGIVLRIRNRPSITTLPRKDTR